MATYVAGISGSESTLVEGLRSEDEGAFRHLYEHFKDRILRTAFRILKEEESAKDALQETMINIHRAADTFRGEAKLATWINRITINVCLEILRKNKRHANRVEPDVSEMIGLENSGASSPFRETYREEVADRVYAALARLSPKHEAVVRMHDIEGHTIRAIAEKLDVAEGTIKSRLFYGREELKKQLRN